MERQDRKRSCWISPINLLRASPTTADVQRFSEVESQLQTTGQVTHLPGRIGYASGKLSNRLFGQIVAKKVNYLVILEQ
jgi:hypothetical protein